LSNIKDIIFFTKKKESAADTKEPAPQRRFLKVFSLQNNESDHLNRLVGAVFNAVAVTVSGHTHIAGMEKDFCAVIIEDSLSLEDIIELSLMLMDMVANGATGLNGNMIEQAGTLIHFLRLTQFLELDGALSAKCDLFSAGTIFRQLIHDLFSFF
jgi:hypothetical protein